MARCQDTPCSRRIYGGSPNHSLRILRLSFSGIWTTMATYRYVSSHRGTLSKFHRPRHLNGSSHLPTQRESSSLETRTSMSRLCWRCGGPQVLSVAAVRKDDSAPNGWRHKFGSYGIAHADGSPMTPDSVFTIASNSKLFLAMSVGLLVSNKTLERNAGKRSNGLRKYATCFRNGV